MDEGHISEELLRRFLRAEVSSEEARRVVRHFVAGCPKCAEVSRQLADSTLLGDEGYEEVFARSLSFVAQEKRRIALEEPQGHEQWLDLEPMNPEERRAIVESDPSYHTLGLYNRLLEAGRRAFRIEPAEAIELIGLAIAVADRLDPQRHGRTRAADLRAIAWGELGNAKRLASDFPGARQTFDTAWHILVEEGSNDPLDRARLLSLEASYLNDLGEYETAETALAETLDLYRQIGDNHLQGRTLFQMGDTIGHISPERGLEHIRKALPLLDPTREPRIELCAWHDFAWYLNDTGRPEEALAALEQARPLYARFSDPYTQLRLYWLEGRIASNLGKLEEAEGIFQHLWREFRARDLIHEIALLAIDLAEVLIRKGETNRAAELLESFYPLYEAWGLHRHVLQSLKRVLLGWPLRP